MKKPPLRKHETHNKSIKPRIEDLMHRERIEIEGSHSIMLKLLATLDEQASVNHALNFKVEISRSRI